MASERILFVDDDPVSRRSFARMMRQSGLLVDLASDGEQAWDLASHFPYAVIATDLRMPGMDGMMLIEQLRELQPDPVCLLVTGCSQFEWYEKCGGAAGSVDVIQKPWQGDQLLNTIQAALSQYRSRRREVPQSERVPKAELPLVALVGLGAALEDEVSSTLQSRFRVEAWNDLEGLPEAVRAASGLACCFVRDGEDSRMFTRALLMQGPQMPIVVLGSGQPEVCAVNAVRSGAQDWLSIEGLRAEDIHRVVAVSAARTQVAGASGASWNEQTHPGLLGERLRQAISRARRYGNQLGVLLVDLDGFRAVNVALGHEGGDALLEVVAKRLRESIRESDAVVRLRQDEFALVLEDLADDPTIEVPAQRVLNTFATPFAFGGNEFVITASIGGAVFPSHCQDASSLVACAEQAVVRAKREGRNRYCLVSSGPTKLVGEEPVAAPLSTIGH